LVSLAPSHAADKRDRRAVALLLPLSGPHAALGASMQRAAQMAEPDASLMVTLDTGGTPAGAAAAAALAVKRGAAAILGPVLADETLAVARVVNGRVPVIAFTNDQAVAASGAYVFGLTPRQTTSAILRYARSRGVKNVAVIGDGTPWSLAVSASAIPLEGEIGLTIRTLTLTPGQPLPDPGEAPDAVLIPGSGDTVLAAARTLRETGIQLLGTVQALDNRPAALAALDGAWLAAPDPASFGKFSSEFETKNGGSPGALAALAYDAASVIMSLRTAKTLSRDGLLAVPSFPCVTGAVKFRTDGTCARDLAILVASAEGYATVATSRGA
jgi:branched-chain amino acid transport system substrate-binding protein